MYLSTHDIHFDVMHLSCIFCTFINEPCFSQLIKCLRHVMYLRIFCSKITTAAVDTVVKKLDKFNNYHLKMAPNTEQHSVSSYKSQVQRILTTKSICPNPQKHCQAETCIRWCSGHLKYENTAAIKICYLVLEICTQSKQDIEHTEYVTVISPVSPASVQTPSHVPWMLSEWPESNSPGRLKTCRHTKTSNSSEHTAETDSCFYTEQTWIQ